MDINRKQNEIIADLFVLNNVTAKSKTSIHPLIYITIKYIIQISFSVEYFM